MPITKEARKEVERLLQQGQKILAIKYLGDTFGVSVRDSKIPGETFETELRLKMIRSVMETRRLY